MESKIDLLNVDHINLENAKEEKLHLLLTVRQKQTAIKHAIQIKEPFIVTTMEGPLKGKAGDYLMIGVDGEKYPKDRDIFERTYEEVFPIGSMKLDMEEIETKLVELFDKGYKTIAIELTQEDYDRFCDGFTTYLIEQKGDLKVKTEKKYQIGHFVSTVNPRIPIKIESRSVFVLEKVPTVTVEGTVGQGFIAVAEAWEAQPNEKSREFKTNIER